MLAIFCLVCVVNINQLRVVAKKEDILLLQKGTSNILCQPLKTMSALWGVDTNTLMF